MASNLRKRKETQKVKSAGGQVIHTADRTASGAVAPHQQRESNPDVREAFRKRVQESIGADMTAGVRGVLPPAQRGFDRTEAVKRRESNKDGRLYITQHPERNLNPYAPKQPQQNPYAGGYVQWGTKDSPEFNALARLAQQAGEKRSKRYGDYMKDSAEAMGRKIDLPGFGMRYPGLAAQEYGKQHSDLDADTEYIRNKRNRNLSGASDAVRPGEEGNEIFKGRGILAPNDRILQNAMLSDEQKRTYNYIYATQGAEEAEKFRNTALEEGGVNAMIAQKAFDADLRNSKYPGKIAATYIGGVEGAADSLAGVPGMIKGEEQYRPRSTAEYFTSEAVRSEPEGSLARTGLELAQSAGTNTLAHLASVAGGPALGSAVFAAQAGARAYNESLMDGHTVGEATAYGAMQALDEEITNYLLGGLSAYGGGAVQRTLGRTRVAQMVGKTLTDIMKTEGGKYAMRQLMDAFASNSGEAAQEYLQHFTEEFEKWVAYNHTSYDVTTPEGRAALANDLPTRQQIAASLTDPEALHEALIGFLNAGLMNAPGQAADVADIMSHGRNSTLAQDFGGYNALADSIDVNPLNYSNPETYQAARDLRHQAQSYAAKDTPATTFERGLIDRAAEEFMGQAAQDPRQQRRFRDAYINNMMRSGGETGEDILRNIAQETPKATPEATPEAPQEETRAAQEAPANEAREQEAPQAEPQAEQQEAPQESAPTESAAKRLTPEEADVARARWNAEQAERKRDIPDRPYARDEVAYRQLTSEEADAARGELKRLQDEAAAYRADREARAASPRGETTLADLAQAAGEQQAETRSTQRQAIVDTAQNLDADSLAGAMDNATMLSEAEKQAAYQEGMNNAVTQMRMEAQNEGSGLSGEGSGRTVSLRAGEQNGGVSQTAGGTAESWTDWSSAADSSLGGRDGGPAAETVETERGTPAEKFLRTATPGQTIYRIKRGSTPSMRKASAMIKKYGGNLTAAPFASSGDIMTKGGESARAFADPSTRTIGYRINSEDAESDKLVRHELVEFGIMDGKVDVSDALKTLSDRMNEVGLGNYVNIISSAYVGGSTSGRLTGVQALEAMRHANKEMLCDISAGINQFKGVRGYEDIAEVVDVAHEIFSDYMNERLGGAFDAESDTDEEILEDANISVNESGTVAHIEYSTKYSWKTDEEIERAVEALQRSLGVSKKKARAFVESERTLTNLILSPGNVAAMDYEADDRYKAIKKNSDYPQGTVDFNNNCRKRVPFTSVFNRLQMRNPNRVFTAGDLETIRQTLIKDKVPVACALCYVEERRQRLGEIANSFVNLYNNNGLREQFAGKRELPKIEDALEKVGNDPYRPTINDLITYEGLRKLSKEHAGIAEAFEIFNNARGMQAGRLVEGRAEYKRELLKLTKAQVKRINDLGGLRVFSYSDFEAVNLLDIVQIIQDAAVMGIKIQAYTKVPAFAKVVRNTGIKLNRSLIAAGTGVRYENGRAVLDLDPVEGIDINDPDFFDSTDDRDVGNILVGMSDEQIRLAMTSPFVDYIIPFHTSLPNTILKAKGIDHWTNYKLSQTDKDMKTGKNAKNINIYTEVLQAAKDEGKPIRNKRQFVEKFLQVAKEKNLIPRFSQFLNVDKNGNYVYTEGYHKFLIDFKLFDKNGNIVEQEVVRPEFDDAFNTKLMEDFANGAGTTAVTDAIYNDVVNALNEQSDGSEVQYSSKLDLTNYDLSAPSAPSDTGIQYSTKITDKALLKKLNDEVDRGDYITTYKAMQLIDGKLYPPMAAKVKDESGKYQMQNASEIGVWQMADEDPRNIKFKRNQDYGYYVLNKGDGTSVEAAYNPYEHSSNLVLNDQFEGAYKRDNLVTVECIIPKSEVYGDNRYKAQYAKDSTGVLDWKSGVVAGKLKDNKRQVYLSRYLKPVRVMSDSEVAAMWKDVLSGSDISVPFNVVSPRLLNALEEEGISIDYEGSPIYKSHNKPKYSSKLDLSGNKDSDGNNLTVGQEEYFKDSKVRDKDGNLMVVYHGTPRGDFTVFDNSKIGSSTDYGWYGKGFYFTDKESAAKYYAGYLRTSRVMKGYLNITNPYELKVPKGESVHRVVADAMGKIYDSAEEQAEAFTEWLKDNGYDGLITKGQYMVFDSNQFKNIDNANPTENEDIRYSSKLDLSDLEEEYQEALKANNKDWQLQVVSSAAYKAGYTVGAYHGSPVENIHVFNTRGDGSKKQAKQLLFGTHFTQNLEYAKIYARKAKNSKGTSRMTSREKQVYNVYLDLGKSLDLRTPQNITPGMEEYALYEDAPAKYKKKYPPHTFSKYDTEQGLGSGQFITKATLENVLQAMPPSEAVDFLTNHGYNSVLYDANYATPTSGNSRLTRDPSIIMLDPERIKSGDPITYDDNGNVIPLSERFNPANDDIRYASKLKLTDELLADLIEKYGALPKGENAQVDVTLPEWTSDTKKTRRYARTVLESGLMTDQMSDEIKEKVIKEALSYEPMTDKDSAEYAASVIRAGGTAKAQKEWDRAKRSDSLNKDDMAVAQFLLKEYANNGDVDNVIKMVEEISAEATRMGQNIQSLRLLKKYAMQAPEVGLGYIQRTVDQMNRDNKRKMGAKYKEMKIDPALAAEYLNAKTSDEIDAALGKIYKDLGSQVQMTGPEAVIDKLRTWRYLSMLGNPRTHVRNFVGNAIFVPAVRLKNVIGAEIEKKAGANRTKALTATPAARAFAQKDALLMRDVLSGKSNMSIRDLIMEQRKVFKTETLNKLSKANSDALEGEDWIFLRMHYQDALAKYITANNMDVNNMDGQKLAQARNYAIQEAQKATYRDANKVSAWLNQSSGAGTVVKYMMEGMLPFKKTPTNILRRGVEYSPAGLIGTLTKGTHDLNTGKITLNEYIDGIASGLSGTAIFGVGMFLASVGAILGGYVDDEDKERRKLRGDQEYAVRIGNHTYTVDWAAPGSLPLFIGVETMYGLKRDHGMTFSDITTAATRLVDPMINMSMLSGLNDTLDAISYSDDKLSAFASETFYSLLGQYVPTISGQIARTIDTTQRINYQDKNTGLSKNMLYFIEKMQNKIPYLTFSNDPYLNEFGQENVTESRFVAAIQNFISPGYLSKVKDDRVLDELDRLSESQDENVLPKKMPKYLGTKEDRVDLTSEQYTTFQRTAGRLSYNIIDNMIDDKRYRQLTAEEQADAISIAYSYAKTAGRIEIQPEYKGKLSGNNKKVYNAVQDGSQAYDVILQIVTSK